MSPLPSNRTINLHKLTDRNERHGKRNEPSCKELVTREETREGKVTVLRVFLNASSGE